MTTKSQALTLIALAATMMAAQAQTTVATPPAQELSPIEQTIQDIKHPVKWMTWGGDLRIRDEYFDNLLTLNNHDKANLHLQDYLRFRARIWANITPYDNLSFYVRLADEVREWLRPAGYTAYKNHSGLDWRDGIFDNLYVQLSNIMDQPLTVKVGRQDILLGDGWLMGDGTPFDGSWTYFLDAARITYELKDLNTTIDLIGIVQDAHDDGWLSTINDQDLIETEQNEKGAVLYIANKSLPAVNVDGYFIYKHDNAINDFAFGSANAKTYRPDNADIYTLGGRLSGMLSDHWKYSAEGAYQFGQKQDPSIEDSSTKASSSAAKDFRGISAFGVNSKLIYLVKDKLNNQFNFSYEFLSGDDPNTHTDEMFDNLWGRWPRWSEIGLYSYVAETRIGNEANLHRFGPGWSVTPVQNLDFIAAYYAMFADEDVATRGAATKLFTGTGNFRGHFLQAVLKYKFSKHVSAHLWAEFEFPGDYYANRSTMYFLRPEVMFTF